MPTEDAAAEILFEEETEVEYNTERPEPENGQRREEEGGSFQCFISLFSNQRQKWIFVSEKGRRLVHVSILERGLGGRRKGGGRAEGAKWPQGGNNSGKGDGVHREGPKGNRNLLVTKNSCCCPFAVSLLRCPGDAGDAERFIYDPAGRWRKIKRDGTILFVSLCGPGGREGK